MAKVVAYTVDYCPYCRKAKSFLTEKGVIFEEIDITSNENEMRSKLAQMLGIKELPTVPQIFINDKPVGGFTDIKALDDSGKLDELLAQ